MMPEQNHQLPPELEWEQMEAGILKKMEELKASSKPDRPAPISKKLLYVLFLEMMTIALLLFFIWPDWNSNPYAQHPLRSAQIASQDLQTDRSAKSYTDSTQSIQNRIPHADGAFFENADTDPQSEKRDDSFRKQKPEMVNKRESYSSSEESIIPPAGKKETTSLKITPVIASDHRIMNGSIGAAASHLQPKILSHSAQTQTPPSDEPAIQRGRKQSPRMLLLGGATLWSAGYGNTLPEREPYESAIVSFQSQLNYIQPLKNDFIFMIGFQFQQLESRFERVYNVDDYRLTLRDTVVEIQKNALTGELTKIRGDVELSVNAQRTVRHYNKTQLFQIPVAVGKTWYNRNWQADVLVGGTLNVLSQNKGRTQYQNELLFYEGSNVEFLNNQWKFNALLAGRLTYYLNKKTGITTGIQFQKSLMNWTSETNVQMRPAVLGLELGLTLSL